MTDDELLALCRIDGLTEDQLAGIDTLGAMADDEVAAFVAAFDAAWEANRQAVADAKAAVPAAIDRLREVEQRVAAEARERDPLRPSFTQEELDAVNEAVARYQAACDDREAAKVRFKAGVTREQLEARL
jgi:hypothetical protein